MPQRGCPGGSPEGQGGAHLAQVLPVMCFLLLLVGTGIRAPAPASQPWAFAAPQPYPGACTWLQNGPRPSFHSDFLRSGEAPWPVRFLAGSWQEQS